MLIRKVLHKTQAGIEEADFRIDRSGHFSFVTPKEALKISAHHIETSTPLFFLPGLFDTHTHGMNGLDFSTVQSTQEIDSLMSAYAQTGVSYVMATLVSLPIPMLKKQLKLLNDYVTNFEKNNNAALLVGIHLEGPWIAHDCKGAHAESALQKEISLTMFKDVVACAPAITEWKLTLAPDIKGALEFIAQSQNVSVNGREIHVQIFIGHTNATSELLDKVKSLIPVNITHLGNANREEKTRACDVTMDNLTSHVVKWALTHPDTRAELIVDGQHLSQEFVQLVYSKLKHNIILITDSLSPAGNPDGCYRLGSLSVTKKGSKITLTGSDKLAGSAATLGEVIERFFEILLKFKIPTKEILNLLYSATVENPRKTAISACVTLPDSNNGVLIDTQTGKIVLSICNGHVSSKVDFSAENSHITSLLFNANKNTKSYSGSDETGPAKNFTY